MKYRVRKSNNKFYPERLDPHLGWVGYKEYDEYLSFDDEDDAWKHIFKNPYQLNINCD